MRAWVPSGIVALGLLAAAPASATPPAPPSVQVTPAIVTAGARVTVAVSHGSGREAFYLSKDRRLSRGDAALGSKAVHPKGGAATLKLRVPRRTPPLAGYLLACAPGAGRRACRASELIAVIRHPDPARAKPRPGGGSPATAAIGPSGGDLTAQAAGGAATLSVPAGALSSQTPLTLTPLASVGGGLPGRLVGAVDMAPGGLGLARLAQLRLPAGARAGIAFDSSGADLHLVPLEGGATPVAALGGGGGVAAPPAKLAAFARRHVAADPLAELAQLVAVRLAGAGGHGRARAARAGEGEAELNAYLTAGAFQVEAIGAADFTLGVARYQQWDDLAKVLPDQSPILPLLETQVKSSLTASGLQQLLDDEAACEDRHELSRRTHMMELEAAAGAIGIGAVGDAVQRAIAKCFEFDLQIDSDLHHHDEEGHLEGEFEWHYQAKVELNYESLVPSATHFTAHGSNTGKWIAASGKETELEPGGCNEDGSTIEGVDELTEGEPGVVEASGDLSVPVAAGELPDVTVSIFSSATETYEIDVRDPQNSNCEAGFSVQSPEWWFDTWLSLAQAGGTSSEGPGGPISLRLEPPDSAKAPPPDLIGEKTIPAAEGRGDHGTTTIRVIHDPGHILFPGLAPE